MQVSDGTVSQDGSRPEKALPVGIFQARLMDKCGKTFKEVTYKAIRRLKYLSKLCCFCAVLFVYHCALYLLLLRFKTNIVNQLKMFVLESNQCRDVASLAKTRKEFTIWHADFVKNF